MIGSKSRAQEERLTTHSVTGIFGVHLNMTRKETANPRTTGSRFSKVGSVIASPLPYFLNAMATRFGMGI